MRACRMGKLGRQAFNARGGPSSMAARKAESRLLPTLFLVSHIIMCPCLSIPPCSTFALPVLACWRYHMLPETQFMSSSLLLGCFREHILQFSQTALSKHARKHHESTCVVYAARRVAICNNTHLEPQQWDSS